MNKRFPKKLVLDASVALKWFLKPEKGSEQAVFLLESIEGKRVICHVPQIFFFEIANALATKSKATKNQVLTALEIIFKLKLRTRKIDISFLSEASLLSLEKNVSVYDASYAILAEKLKIDLITADGKFHQKINLPFVKLLKEGIVFLNMISRQEALQFVKEQIANKNIVKHMLATESCMRAIGKELGIDGETLKHWELAGLLHDADYIPDIPEEQQGVAVTKMLREQGFEVPDDVAQAMAAHNPATGVAPVAKMDWAIFCCDSLTGLIVATTLVHPEEKLHNITVESVMKKFKDKSFAAGTRREDIAMCEEKLGIPLQEFIGICLTAMQGISEELGL
ncbi:MAG: PIN domain-containing protein [Candidatus Cloacimonetes bacterium]|nr:PIN domain-containing protein [Candidatus Cloacimonadota bacterium]